MLTSSILGINRLSSADINQMWAVFSAHYADVSRAAFERDLSDKSAAVLMRDDSGVAQGFSTYRVLEDEAPGGPAHFLFSGDTVVDRAYWGRNDFALTWIRNAGRLETLAPRGGLYWFLIVKGHRTYRYLPTFAHEFHPHWAQASPDWMKALADRLARQRFGTAYDAAKGLVRFATPHGRLAPAFAEISERDRKRSDVAFFLSANPDYARGDELVCLCRLTAENLRPIARRAFEAGAAAARASDAA